MRVLSVGGNGGRRPVQWKNGTEAQVLDHGELAEHFVAPHFVHATTDLAPALRSTNVV